MNLLRPAGKAARIYLLLLGFGMGWLNAQKPIIVDADTANEVDDLFALARILMDPEVEVTALNAAHWQGSHWSVPQSMEESHRLNQQLLGEMGLEIRTFRGGAARMYDWGDRARHSAAAYEIIRQARQRDSVVILALGALTNIASAVYIQPDIAKKLRIYWLGTTLDFESGVLKRNDFNALMDPYALDYLLDSKATLYIMPLNTARTLEVSFEKWKAEIGSHFLGRYLLKRWEDHLDGARQKRVLWDLALVAAFLNPEFGRTRVVRTSRDSGGRPIVFFSQIDPRAITRDFWNRLKAFQPPGEAH